MNSCFQKLYAMYPDKKIDSIKDLIKRDLKLYNDIRNLSSKENKTPSKLILDNGFSIKNIRQRYLVYYYKRLNQEFNIPYRIIGDIFGISKQAVEQQIDRAKKYDDGFRILESTLDKTEKNIVIDMIQNNKIEQKFKENDYHIFTNTDTQNICIVIIEGTEVKCLFKEDLKEIEQYIHKYKYLKYKETDIKVANKLKELAEDNKIYIEDLDKSFIAKIRKVSHENCNSTSNFFKMLGLEICYSYNINKEEDIKNAFEKYKIFDKYVRIPKYCHLYTTIKIICDMKNITFKECVKYFGYDYLDDISFYKRKIEKYIKENKKCLNGTNLYLDAHSLLYKSLALYSNRHNLDINDVINKCGYSRVYYSDTEECTEKKELVCV